jgi:hypothetical protein
MRAGRPATILSKPLLKRNIWPCRVISPSAKMHTAWPLSRALRAFMSDSITFLGPSRSEIGMAPRAR